MIEWDYDHEEIEWWHSTKTINSDRSLRYQKYYKNDKFMENRKVIKNQLVQQKKQQQANHAWRILNFLPPLLYGEHNQ